LLGELCYRIYKGSNMLSLKAPKQVVFLSSLILAIIAVINVFVHIPDLTLWLMAAAYVVLALGCVLGI
jgi:hypothetical protein